MISMLMWTFAKVALGAFGGGLATIPFIHRELVVVHGWLTEEMFGQTIALAQMTPGPVALNAATFVGYRLGGSWGSLWATVALVGTPVLVIALLLWLISIASQGMQAKIATFQRALRPAVAGLLLVAFLTLAKPLIPDISSFRAALPGLSLVALALLCLALSQLRPFKAYPQLLILLAALAGLLLKGLLIAP
ncbi:MAG: chromate transporter [Synergistaceae bacterium]|nr:chromate transporter [Synergistaceae bacterium]